MSRFIRTIALSACALALAAAPARAAFCGPATDVAAIEKLTIQTYGKTSQMTHPIDETYVRIVDVSKTTHLPVRILGYEGPVMVRSIVFSDVKLEPQT